MRSAALFAVVLLIAGHSRTTEAQSAPVVDWTSIDYPARTASGMLASTPVTFSWSPNGSVPTTYFSGNAPWFNNLAFTPSFESTDGLEVVARKFPQAVPTYTITFDAAISNPVLHIASNASTLTFIGATPQRVSGDERFSVSGNRVIGVDYNDPNGIDANGTVVFPGSHSSLSFTAEYFGTAPTSTDGITIQVGVMPGSSLMGLEVVQVVQDWRNSVPLVAGKDTVVRAHLAAPLASPSPLRVVAQLFGFDAQGQPLNPPLIFNGFNQGAEMIQLPLVVDRTTRASLHRSVNFYLPTDWLQPGVRTFRFEVSEGVPAAVCAEQAPPFANDCAVSVNFEPRRRIVLQALRTQFQDPQSTQTECANTGGEYVDGICTYLTSRSDLRAVCARIQRQLPTHDLSCELNENPIFLTPANDRPTGDEMMELVVRRKRESCFWLVCDDFYMAITGFRSREGYRGQGYLPAPVTEGYRTAWAVKDALNQKTATHEFGHNLGLQHTTFADPLPGDGDKYGTCEEKADEEHLYPPLNTYYFPYYHVDSLGNLPRLGPILPNAEQTLVFGFDRGSPLDRPPTGRAIGHDAMALMSYCDERERWMDVGSYGALFAALAPLAPAAAVLTPTNSSAYFWVAGSWNRTTDAAHFDPIEITTPPVAPPVPGTGILELLIHYNGGPDVAQPLAPSASPNEPNQFSFHAWVPQSPAVTGFTLRRNGMAIAHTQVSAHAPQLAITGPAPGGSYIGQGLTLSWSASDTDGDPLSFRIEYSSDGGSSWEMLSSGWPASPFVVSSDLLQSTPTALFRVTAMDGFLSATATMTGPIAVYGSTIFGDGFE